MLVRHVILERAANAPSRPRDYREKLRTLFRTSTSTLFRQASRASPTSAANCTPCCPSYSYAPWLKPRPCGIGYTDLDTTMASVSPFFEDLDTRSPDSSPCVAAACLLSPTPVEPGFDWQRGKNELWRRSVGDTASILLIDLFAHRVNDPRLSLDCNLEGDVASGFYCETGHFLRVSRRPSSPTPEAGKTPFNDDVYIAPELTAVKGLQSVFASAGQDSWETARRSGCLDKAHAGEASPPAWRHRFSVRNASSVFPSNEGEETFELMDAAFRQAMMKTERDHEGDAQCEPAIKLVTFIPDFD